MAKQNRLWKEFFKLLDGPLLQFFNSAKGCAGMAEKKEIAGFKQNFFAKSVFFLYQLFFWLNGLQLSRRRLGELSPV